MILLGALVAVWGALVLGFAKTMHVRWKGMLAEMRRSGVVDTIPLTRWFASEGGLRGMRLGGGIALAAGIAMIVSAILRS